jgi:hypothetical protein
MPAFTRYWFYLRDFATNRTPATAPPSSSVVAPDILIASQAPAAHESLLTGAQGLATNDAQIIDAALKTIFEKSAWNTWWTNGDFLVLYPLITNELPRQRSSLSRKLDDFIHALERGERQWIKGSNDLEVLKEIRTSAGPDSDPETPRMAELKDMDLDLRIMVSSVLFGKPFQYFAEPFRSGGASITNRMGKKGRVISTVSFEAPGYSRNGRYAVLETGIHHYATLADFFLENKDGHWRVVQVIIFPIL